MFITVELVGTICENDKTVWDLTTLNDELYVVYWSEESWDYDVIVYSNDVTDPESCSFRRLHTLDIPELGGVVDIAPCTYNQCIYIADTNNNVIHRVQKNNDDDNAATRWPVNDKPQGLSVNSSHNVLVTCRHVGKIKEFTGTGQLTQVIDLQPDIVTAWHAVAVGDNFVVCHGDVSDALNRVCVVNAQGALVNSYGSSPGSARGQLNTPIRLGIFRGFVVVADYNNHRVVMLNGGTLSYQRDLVSGLCDHPCRLWIDEQTSRVFVAENKWTGEQWVKGKVKIYKL